MPSPPLSAFSASTLAVDHQRRRRRTRLLLFGANPDDLAGTDDPTRDDIRYEHGRLFLAATGVYGPTDKGHPGELSNVAVGVESTAP
ncbi:hypothetical protein [Streptomyces sp. NPDC026659]|uniref:hypothetical protein n=1 Tax=Streptomyces sp. NPDC026659 TaxID=3155123 RepID=UPI0033FAB884